MIIQAEKSNHLPSASWREGSCVVGPVKVAVLLLSDLPLPDQSLLHKRTLVFYCLFFPRVFITCP